MGLVSRGARLLAALVVGACMAGCGGSVADADRPSRTTTPSRPSSPFCAAVQANSTAIQPLNGLSARGGVPPDQLRSTVDEVRRTGADLLFTAPEEIRIDVQRTVEALNLQLDALLAAGGNAGALSRDPALTARLASPEVTSANQRVSAYVNRSCGPGR